MLNSITKFSCLLFLFTSCTKEEEKKDPVFLEVIVKDKSNSTAVSDASVTVYVRDDDGSSWAYYGYTDQTGLAKVETKGHIIEELTINKIGYYGYCKNQFISPVYLDAIAYLRVHFINDTPSFHSDLINFYYPGDYYCYDIPNIKSLSLTGINDTSLVFKTLAGNHLLRWKVTSDGNWQVYSEPDFFITAQDTTEFEIVY